MMVFLGDIAFYVAALVLGAGIFMIHHANHHDTGKPCKLLKLGGYALTVISILGMICTGYYWIKYYWQGSYGSPHCQHHSMMPKKMMGFKHKGMMNQGGMMGNMQHCMGQMEGKMMDPSMMQEMKSCIIQKTPSTNK